MSDYLALVLLTLVLIALSFGVLRSFLRVWFDHRFRSALLREYESSSESFESFDEVERKIREREEIASRGRPQDFRLTGAFLAALGVGGLMLGHWRSVLPGPTTCSCADVAPRGSRCVTRPHLREHPTWVLRGCCGWPGPPFLRRTHTCEGWPHPCANTCSTGRDPSRRTSGTRPRC